MSDFITPIEAIKVIEHGYDLSSNNATYARRYVINEADRTDQDRIEMAKYSNIQVSSKIDDYRKYSGINAAAAQRIIDGSAKNGINERVTPNDLIIEYDPMVLSRIHTDMQAAPTGGAFATDIELKDSQVDLINSTQRLYYQYGSLIAVNNSETGTGKTVMAMAQGLMSGNPYWIINCPAQAQYNWRQAAKAIPGIRDDLYRLTGIWYRWPVDILLVSTNQLRGDNGRGESIFHSKQRDLGSVQLLTKKPKTSVFEVTGNKYNIVNNNVMFGEGVQSPSLAPNAAAPVDKFAQFNVNQQTSISGVSGRGIIEAGVIYINDEWHSNKNDSTTSHSNGAIAYEIMMSAGGIKGFRLPGDQVANPANYLYPDQYTGGMNIGSYIPENGYPEGVLVPYGGAVYGSLNRDYDFKDQLKNEHGVPLPSVTGRSRILLLSSTTTDKSNTAPLGRAMGLYAGAAVPSSSSYGNFVSNMIEMINNLKYRYDYAKYNNVYEGDRDGSEGFPVPNILRDEFIRLFADPTAGYPDMNTIVVNILSDPFFVKAISYEGEYILRMTDLIIPLVDNNAEREMKHLVFSASKAIGGKTDDGVKKATVAGEEKLNSTIAMMQISISIVDEVVRDAIATLNRNPNNRVIISFRFTKSIVRAVNIFLHNPAILQALGIIAPLVMAGEINSESRKYVAALFNNNLQYRLLIANQDIISESNSYHDIHGGRETTMYSEIPNNAVRLYQYAGRVLRIGTKSDSELKIVSPGLRYGFEFDTIPGVGDYIWNSERIIAENPEIPEVQKTASRQFLSSPDINLAINDKVINHIIGVHNQMRDYGYSVDEIHVKLAYDLDDHIRDVFIQLLSAVLVEVGLAYLVYQRMVEMINKYQLSLVDLLHRRDEKAEQLKSMTSKVRYVPQSDGFYEHGSIVASYIDPDSMADMRREAYILRQQRQQYSGITA